MRERRADQGQPERHPVRHPRGGADRPGGRLCPGGLGTVGRDRGRLPGRPRRGYGRGPDQDRFVADLGSPGQVQPAATDRRGRNPRLRRPDGDRPAPPFLHRRRAVMAGSSATSATPPAAMVDFLERSGLTTGASRVRWTPLTGGVSSDLWRVDTPGLTVCVKAALATLRVAHTWNAPLSRNAVEGAWLRFAAQHAPPGVPRVLAHDGDAGLFAMEFLAPEQPPVGKAELMAGRVDPASARQVGDLVGRLAAASTDPGRRDALSRRFATDDNFHRLRIEPYLLATAHRRPEVGARLTELAERTQAVRMALVHGDVSPKNILLGPHGPVLLDAECAWWGDPAFDVAFCLNHLLLKALVAAPAERSARAQRLSLAAEAWWSGYGG